MRARAGGLLAVLVLTGAACGAVNMDQLEPDAARGQLSGLDAEPPAAEPIDLPDGLRDVQTHEEQIEGFIEFGGRRLDLGGTGVLSVTPWPAANEVRLARYYADATQPYEAMTVAVTDKGLYLEQLSLINPLDPRLVIECAFDGGIHWRTSKPVTGVCTDGSELTGDVEVAAPETVTWRGRPVVLRAVKTSVRFSGPMSGTLVETNFLPEDDVFALRAEIEAHLELDGLAFDQSMRRWVLPAYEEGGG